MPDAQMTDEKEKKRPRPLELSHSNLVPGEETEETEMGDLAMQCASPGLPPLSAKMKTTVLQSKSIEQQQRHIIAQRASEGPVDGGSTGGETAPSTSGLTSTMEDLAIPSANSNKRLKRSRVPTPLSLSPVGAQHRPTIKSAPIYNVPQFFTPQFRRQPLRSAVPRVRMTPVTPYSRAPHTAAASRYPANQMNSLTQLHMAKFQQQVAHQQQQWAKFRQLQESQAASHVTDVFQGEGTRLAPLEAQPLSAQRRFFDVRPQAVVKPIEEEEDGDDDDPESAAIEDDAEVGTGIKKEHVVPTELRLGNNVFRFELERRGESDKERFLSHCATAWEQYSRV